MTRITLLTGLLLVAAGPALSQGADDCTQAQGISGAGPFAFHNTNATMDGLPDALCNFFTLQDIDHDVWFAWTAPNTAMYVLSTCGQTTVDTKIAIYDGGCGGTIIGCGEDDCGTLQTEVCWVGQAGSLYLVRLGTYPGAAGGTGTFTITEIPPTQDPVGGHNYLAVKQPNITWDAAQAIAAGSTWSGQPGHLATLTDQAENDFVYALADVHWFWVGGYQDVNDPAYSEPLGAWKWVTGETWSYANWYAGEPNNTGAHGDENYLELLTAAGGFADAWNDAHPLEHPAGYVVEYGPGGVQVYCTAKVNSAGCTPSIAASGTPSVTDPNPFDITAGNVLDNKVGMLFYGYAPASIPFQGGWLCVQPPIKRTWPQHSGGSPPPPDCTGQYTYDFNGRIQSGVDPSLSAGALAAAQYWTRDPASPSTTGLTDAVMFVIEP